MDKKFKIWERLQELDLNSVQVIESNLNSGIYKLRDAVFNKRLTGLLITESELAAILFYIDQCSEFILKGKE